LVALSISWVRDKNMGMAPNGLTTVKRAEKVAKKISIVQYVDYLGIFPGL
jgi:hypothetical protein